MFDTIIVEGLKLKAPKEVTSFLKANNAELPTEFQTKDLDNVLATYRIKENGQIYEDVRRPTGKKILYESFFKNWEDKRPLLEKLYWKFKNKTLTPLTDRYVEETKTVTTKSKLNKTLNILSCDEIGGKYLTLEYELKSINGKVLSNKLIRWEIEPEEEANDRHKRDEEFKFNVDANFAIQKAFRSKWYYPIIRETYNPFIFFSRLLIQKTCNKIINLSYRWTGV